MTATRSRGMTRLDLLIVLVLLNALWALSYWALYRIATQGFDSIKAVPTPHHAAAGKAAPTNR